MTNVVVTPTKPLNIITAPIPPLNVGTKVVGPPGPPGEGGATLEANTFSGTQNYGNNDLEDAKTVTFNGEYDNGNSGSGTVLIDWEHGQFQKITLTGSCVISVSNPPGVCHNQLRIIQDEVGNHDVTWMGLNPNRWIGTPTVPAINNTSSGETVVNMFFDGVNILQSMCRIGTA